jgi:hypothetical protein
MAATVRSTAEFAAGPVLTNSRLSVADDGLVTLDAQYATLPAVDTRASFRLDSAPVGSPASVDTTILAGGQLFLVRADTEVSNGIKTISAQYAGALAETRIVQSQSIEERRFEGELISSTIGGARQLSFDYKIATVTFRYAILAARVYAPTPRAFVVAKYNIKREGSPTEPRLEQVVSETNETIGLIKRVTRTASGVYVDTSRDFLQNRNPWLIQSPYTPTRPAFVARPFI